MHTRRQGFGQGYCSCVFRIRLNVLRFLVTIGLGNYWYTTNMLRDMGELTTVLLNIGTGGGSRLVGGL